MSGIEVKGAEKPAIVVLLGAGASVGFDLPDNRKLAAEVTNNLQHYRKRIIQIREVVKRAGVTDDIEAVLSILQFCEDPSKASRDLGPLSAILQTSAALCQYDLGIR